MREHPSNQPMPDLRSPRSQPVGPGTLHVAIPPVRLSAGPAGWEYCNDPHHRGVEDVADEALRDNAQLHDIIDHLEWKLHRAEHERDQARELASHLERLAKSQRRAA